MKKITLYILIIITLIGFSSPKVVVYAQSSTSNYTLLAPLPDGKGGTPPSTVDTSKGLGAYLNPMLQIFIGLCAVLSVIMIVIGGMEYMTSELSHSKEAGKEKIIDALLGLVIALGAYALLNSINPDLLKTDFNPGAVNATPTSGNSPGGTCSHPEYTDNFEECKNSGGDWIPNPTAPSANPAGDLWNGRSATIQPNAGVVPTARTQTSGCTNAYCPTGSCLTKATCEGAGGTWYQN